MTKKSLHMSQAKLGISDEVNGKSEAPLERTPPRGKPPNNPGAPPTVLVHQFPPQTNKLGGLFSPLPKIKGKEGQRGGRPKPFQSPPLTSGTETSRQTKVRRLGGKNRQTVSTSPLRFFVHTVNLGQNRQDVHRTDKIILGKRQWKRNHDFLRFAPVVCVVCAVSLPALFLPFSGGGVWQKLSSTVRSHRQKPLLHLSANKQIQTK